MVGLVVGGVAAVGVIALAYKDRAKLAADLKAAEDKAENVETAVKAKIKQEVDAVVADIKAWDAKAKEGVESVIAQFEARIKQIL